MTRLAAEIPPDDWQSGEKLRTVRRADGRVFLFVRLPLDDDRRINDGAHVDGWFRLIDHLFRHRRRFHDIRIEFRIDRMTRRWRRHSCHQQQTHLVYEKKIKIKFRNRLGSWNFLIVTTISKWLLWWLFFFCRNTKLYGQLSKIARG